MRYKIKIIKLENNVESQTQILELEKELELKNIRIFPGIEKSQVLAALRTAKCCLAANHDHPVYRYGLSMNKLNDYLLSGRPIVFASSFPNVVQEAGQFTLPYGDKKLYAETIRKIKDISPDKLKEIGDRSISLIRENYDYRVIVDKLEQML